MDNACVSYVGTVIGVTLGSSYLANTLLFSNITFIIQFIEFNELASGIFLSTLIVLANVVLWKDISKDLMSFQCIKKRFPERLKSKKIRYEDY